MYQGFNWDRNYSSRWRMCIWLWKFQWYFRIRSKALGGKRVISDLHFIPENLIGNKTFELDWETRSVWVDGDLVSYEILVDMVHARVLDKLQTSR